MDRAALALFPGALGTIQSEPLLMELQLVLDVVELLRRSEGEQVAPRGLILSIDLGPHFGVVTVLRVELLRPVDALAKLTQRADVNLAGRFC